MSVHSETESDGGEGEARVGEVWQRVHVCFQGSLVTIRDPSSGWLMAEKLLEDEEVASAVARVMFRSFCCFGFPRVELICGLEQGERVRGEYQELVERAAIRVPELRGLDTELVVKQGCSEVPCELLGCGGDELAVRLLLLRLARGVKGSSPFQAMLGRPAIVRGEGEIGQTRRKLQSSLLHCRHCAETFTSKISFRIHQRRHTEEARLQGQREGEAARKLVEADEEGEEKVEGAKKRRPGRLEKSRQLKRRRLARLASSWVAPGGEADQGGAVAGQAATAVQALLQVMVFQFN